MKRKASESGSPGNRVHGARGGNPAGVAGRSRVIAEAAGLAALLPESFSLSLLVHLGVPAEVLDRCFDDGLFVERGAGVAAFRDPAARKRSLDALTWAHRRKMHRRIAEALEATGGSPEEIAAHFSAAHAYPEARQVWIRQARESCARKRYGDAVAAFGKALEMWPAGEDETSRREVLSDSARCAENEGRHDFAEWALEAYLASVTDAGDLEAAIEACHRLAEIARRCCDPEKVRRHLLTAAGIADRLDDKRAIARNRFALAAYLADRIRLHGALKEIEIAERAAAQSRDPKLHSEIIGFRGLILAMLGRPREARETVDASLRLALAGNNIDAVATAYKRLANLCDYAADYPGERDAQLKVISFCREKNLVNGVPTCLSCLSYAFFRTGEWKRAIETAREVLRADDTHPSLDATVTVVLGLISTFRGERRNAARLIDTGLLGARRENIIGIEFFALWARAFLAAADGRMADAAATYAEIRLLWRETEDVHDVVPALFSASAFHADHGRPEDLRECVDILNRIASGNDTAETRAARDAAQGEALCAAGHLPEAIDHLRRAVSEFDQVGAPVERVLARIRLGRALAAGTEGDEASECWREARGIAERLGMRLVLEMMEEQCPAVERVEKDGTRSGGLTPRQLEVVGWMAQGLTNKEIAARLSLSTRTVEMHVDRALKRLNCRTRAQAVRRAAELELV